MSSPRTTLPARIAALAAIAGLLTTGAYVATRSSDTAATTPDPPALVKLRRPVVLRWAKTAGASSYRIWVNGVVVRTTTGLTATVMIPCSGHTASRLNVQAQNGAGRSPMHAPLWRIC
jgi:hypothetical protein